MQLREIMTSAPHAIPHSATVKEAAKMMRDHDVGMLPVMEDGKMIGAITDRDIVIHAVAEGGDPEDIPVSQAMTSNLISAYEDTDVEAAARLMEERQVRRLVVINAEQQLVGVVSLGDLALRRGDEGRLSGDVLADVSKPS